MEIATCVGWQLNFLINNFTSLKLAKWKQLPFPSLINSFKSFFQRKFLLKHISSAKNVQRKVKTFDNDKK